MAHFAVLLRRYEKYELWMAVVAIEHAVLAIKSFVGSIAQEEPHKVTVAKRDQAAAEADLRLEKEALRRRQDAGHYENGASGVSQPTFCKQASRCGRRRLSASERQPLAKADVRTRGRGLDSNATMYEYILRKRFAELSLSCLAGTLQLVPSPTGRTSDGPRP